MNDETFEVAKDTRDKSLQKETKTTILINNVKNKREQQRTTRSIKSMEN